LGLGCRGWPGLALPVGGDVRASLEELRHLERSFGPTGRRAMKPVMRRDTRDLWQLQLLEQAGRGRA
jgi:hypothetical protein